jgi:D-3-phosphoglycerate dehydrogenase
MKILANDGLSDDGIRLLEEGGCEVITVHVAQEQLISYINDNQIDGLVVRSNTQVPAELLEACPSLKVVARAGVGMDNIDVEYAKNLGIHVINTPKASSNSVAELVFAHLFGLARFLHDANRNMPLEGDQQFKALKKHYSKGVELRGKTMGIIGLGSIGQATAKIALSLGMRVLAYDPFVEEVRLDLEFFDGQMIGFDLKPSELETVLKESDFISLHVPSQSDYLIGKKEIEMMKPSAILINAARGGVVDEVALVEALNQDKIAFAGLDVFENEPKPEIQILMHPQISLTPHTGASTLEAQKRVGIELAEKVLEVKSIYS